MNIDLKSIGMLLLLSSCEHYDGRLEIVNETAATIAAESYTDSIPNLVETNGARYYMEYGIRPAEHRGLMRSGKNGWLFAIKGSKNNRLNLVIYDIDSIKKYNCMDSLIQKGIYNSFSFSEEELDSMNWKIVIKNM